MSEIKRAQLLPLGPQKESDKTSKEPRKTIRIAVVLPESTEDTCPEYNYKDELASAKKSHKQKEMGLTVNGNLSRLDDLEDDDDVKRIARQMEEKYGTVNKKKRKGRKDDYADIGMGYDESDSFIDNTDGYDEMIPQNVTTLHGGFYINSGALEFKTDDEADSDFSSSSSEDESAKKTSRKRVIESSDETDRENKTESDVAINPAKKKKISSVGNGIQPSLKKKLLAQNKVYIKKRRPLDPLKKTVKELLREKREDLDMSIPEELKVEELDEDQKDKKNMNISNVTDVIESVVKAATEDIKTESSANVVVNSSSDGESSHDNSNRTVPMEVKLPENLSADILSVINAIKTAAGHCSLDGKNNFSSEINLLILRLERKSKCLGKPSKMKVYEHLSVFLKCKSDSLIKKAKSLVLEDDQKKVKNLLASLKSEINKIMPSLLEVYEKESQRVLQKKFSQESADNEENKSLRMPKRRFQWNDITKKQFKDILMLKKRCLLLEGKSKDAVDGQMAAFLKTELQVLWPEGWMSMNALNKIYSTYADPKRLSSSSDTSSPQSFATSNLSITPIMPCSKPEPRVLSVGNEVSLTKTDTSLNLSVKPLPEPCDKPASPKKEMEIVKLKVKPVSELLKPSISNHAKSEKPFLKEEVIILDGMTRLSDKKSDDSYCQVIDLSDKNDLKTVSPMLDPLRHHELSITPSYPKSEPPKSKANDDIQKVMEDLKVLQKMSSPKKSIEVSPSSSAVSVIAVNKSFAPKQQHESSTMQRYDYDKRDYNSSFQEEFQKQLYNSGLSYQYSSANSRNSIERFPHITSSTTGLVSGDKYFQSANNNYTQSSNGHKGSTSAQQSGTYSILDDMFANLLTQYGYSKEAAAPKSQQK